MRGIRSGDKGRGRDGEELGNFEPGSDLMAKATVLAEGTVSHLTQCAVDYFDLAGDSMRWEIGVKEIWKVPKPLDRVIHTMNWPLRGRPKYNEFGGSFIYPMGEDKLTIGMVVGLDTTDATFSCHDALQQLKTHPFVRKLLDGGERVGWGAKTIPSGGYWSMPRRLSVPGMVMCGDNVSMVNVPYLKGIHYAMHAGMYAAEAIVESLKQDSVNFEEYERKVKDSMIEKDLYRSRNVRQYGDKGFIAFGGIANAWLLSRGAVPPGHKKVEPDAEVAMEIDGAAKKYPKPDNKYIFDKLSSVFLSGNATRDDAPNHIRIQERVPQRGRPDLGLDVPGAGLRDPRGAARVGRRDRRRQRHRLELRPVRRDHRQGRPPDAARGRRRPPVHRDLIADLIRRTDPAHRVRPWASPAVASRSSGRARC